MKGAVMLLASVMFWLGFLVGWFAEVQHGRFAEFLENLYTSPAL